MVKAKRRRAADKPPQEQAMFWVDSDGEQSPRHKRHKEDDDENFIDLWADGSDDSSDDDEEPDFPNHSTDGQLADFIDLCNSDDEVVEILSDDLDDDDELPPLIDSRDDTHVLAHRQVRNAGRNAARQGMQDSSYHCTCAQ